MARRPFKVQPIERFPEKPRKDGRFQKRIRGELHYFGSGGDRETALAEYNAQKDDLYAGRVPSLPTEAMPRVTLKHLANRFDIQKMADRDAGRITTGWYDDCYAAIDRFLGFRRHGLKFAHRLWHDLKAEDLADYARHLHAELGVHAYNRERSIIAAMFNMADEFGWISRPIRLRKAFAKRSAGEARGQRKDWLLTAAILRPMYRDASLQIKGMILLGLNGGFGPGDDASLPKSAVDFKSGRIRYKRPKTNIDRDMPMWPETIKVLKLIFAERPDDPLVFRTKYGNPWTAPTIAAELEKIGNLPKGVKLNACRHTFATYAQEVQGVGKAYKRLMGRKITEGVDETYIDRIFLPKLKKVVNHVRRRLMVPKMVLASRK